MNGVNETLETAATTYHQQLLDEPTGLHGCREYLTSRALGNPATITQFRYGYVAEPLPGDENYRGRLAIPYLTPTGVVAMKYRCIEPHDCKTSGGQYHSKYAQPVGQDQHLYNVAAYHSGRNVLGMIEGEIDAATVTAHLDLPTMGVPGTEMWTKHGWFWQLALQDFELIIIFADGDKPKCLCAPKCVAECVRKRSVGMELAKEIAVAAESGRSRIVQVDDGQDANKMVAEGRVDELRKKAGLA